MYYFCNYNASGEYKRNPDKNPAQCVFFSLHIYFFNILLEVRKLCDWKINNTQVFNYVYKYELPLNVRSDIFGIIIAHCSLDDLKCPSFLSDGILIGFNPLQLVCNLPALKYELWKSKLFTTVSAVNVPRNFMEFGGGN